MKCSEIRDLLSAYIDGVLDEAEKTQVEQHISTCSGCLQELTDLRGTVNLLQNLGEVSPPPDFRLQLRKRLEEDNTGGRGFKLRQRIRRLAFGPWKYAAAAVVILGLGVSMGVMNLRMGAGLHSYAGKGSSPEIALSQSNSSPSENMDSYDSSKNKSETGSQSHPALPDLEQMKLYDQGSDPPSTSQKQARATEQAQPAKDSSTIGTKTVERGSNQEPALNASGQVPVPDSAEVPQGVRSLAAPPPETSKNESQPPQSKILTANSDSDAQTEDTALLNAEKQASDETTAARVNEQTQTKSEQTQTKSEQAQAKPEQDSQDQAAPKPEQKAQDQAAPKPEQKIIKDGSLVLEVDKYRDFSGKLPALVGQYDGYIEKSEEVSGPPVSASFTVRVPAARFTELFNRIATMGTVITKQVSGRDVTGEYVDVQARLRSLQTQEARLLGLVDKAGTVSDVVSLESELGRVRGEIEALQGRLKVLDNTIVYSTIRLEVREVATSAVQPAQGVLGKTIRNFKNSIASMVNMAGDLVAFMGWFLPWAILLGGIGGGIYYYRKKAGRKN